MFLFNPTIVLSQSASKLISGVKSTDGTQTFTAKDSLEKREGGAIDMLLPLVKDPSFIKLRNTADLIYPGAPMLYGHGSRLEYDIDWIFIRAGWLIETIAFQDFGFWKLHLSDYPTWKDTSDMTKEELELPKKSRQEIEILTERLYDSVKTWWESEGINWNRRKGLRRALESNNIRRQYLALTYLREDYPNWGGLTKEEYLRDYKPLIEDLKNRSPLLLEIIKMTLDDVHNN